MNVLIKFRHGLGDAVQLTAVLQMLRHYRPEWSIDVAALPGKHSLYRGLCRRSLELVDVVKEDYDHIYNLDWWESHRTYHECPSTKVSLCLDEVFGLPPEPLTYSVNTGQAAADRVSSYVNGLGPIGLLHYQGNTSSEHKDLDEPTARWALEAMRRRGLTPVLLDWDRRSPLCATYENPGRGNALWGRPDTGDGETLVALCQAATVVVAIDSGPLHCAMATDTPTIGVWTHHHPIHFADVSPATLHLVPHDHASLIRGDQAVGLAAFRRLYRHSPYHCLAEAIEGAMSELLDEGLYLEHGPFAVRRQFAEQDLVIVRDVYYEDTYRMRIFGEHHRSGPQVVVDVGAHIGSFTKLYQEINPQAKFICIEACSENIPVLQRNVGDDVDFMHAACTYEDDIALWNAVFAGTESTGGSIVTKRSDERLDGQHSYRRDSRPLRTVTLEDIMGRLNVDAIDILKLDCEGSEFSILGNSPQTDRIGLIVGEFHGYRRWHVLRNARFRDWDYSEIRAGDLGTFHLRNPKWKGCWNDPR